MQTARQGKIVDGKAKQYRTKIRKLTVTRNCESPEEKLMIPEDYSNTDENDKTVIAKYVESGCTNVCAAGKNQLHTS